MNEIVKWLLFVVVLLNFASFFWSVIGVFLKPQKQALLKYRLLQIASLLFWTLSLIEIVSKNLLGASYFFLIIIQALCLGLFWHQAPLIKKHKFPIVFSKDDPHVFTDQGLYRWIRHPYYSIYLLSYLSLTAFYTSTQNLYLFFLCFFLVGFYVMAARAEENVFLQSEFASSYSQFQKQTGMFFPKIKILARLIKYKGL